MMDPRRSNIGGPDTCDPCGIDAYGCNVVWCNAPRIIHA